VARKVLIADDSPTIQKKADWILTGQGYEVVTVSNGVAAVRKLPAVMPLVVLADVTMPGKDGYEVCEFVKNHDVLKTVPVLLVFSEMDPVEEEKAARAHADGRISKPFNSAELISMVGKFAAMAEAAVSELAAAPSLPVPARPVYVTEPVDAEPEPELRQELPDMSAFSGGLGIGDVTPEEHYTPSPSPPERAMELAPAFEEPSALEEAPPIEVEPQVETPAEIAAPGYQAAEPEASFISDDPVLVEESSPSPAAWPVEDEPLPTERTMLFHTPSEVAEPVLSEEATEESAPLEAAARPAEPGPEAEIPPVAATTLESFSLREAESGQVWFPVAEEAPPAPEAVEPPPAPFKTFDEAQIFSIVHQVVAKMSPPVLSPQMVEDIARRFADELIQDFNSQP